jgi:hypothetical protein
MFKRMTLALTFVVALCAAGVGVADKATAYGGCGRGGHGGGYGVYYPYYGGHHGYYPSYYSHGYTYVPPVVYYPGSRHRHHRHHHHHHDHDRGGVSFSIGF